ncbi:hypothetical protein GCM10022243_54040 [Saccharothrix violaceirubra]|uniref:Uncharacterized protein n=1 Tax=Saccharothrix violaceirubra TaxID=413306 RepID=A0A7W7WU83_9PSEU|nr:hypothetical protein [Saccharothrix violaceirubra]MBB4963467.1 hypothetical protein [Saccharothrix violaceirubra]
MTSLGDVAACLANPENKVEQAAEALHRARELAGEAANLTATATSGSNQADVEDALSVFEEIDNAYDELAGCLAASGESIRRIRAALLGGNPTTSSDRPRLSAPTVAPARPTSEKSWAQQQRDRLPTYITSGVYIDEDGNTELVQSGRETNGEHVDIGAHLIEQGYPLGGRGRVAASERVETKVAGVNAMPESRTWTSW